MSVENAGGPEVQTGFISFRQIRKSYGHGAAEIVAVERLDLDILQGEFMTLLGPSGSGKTTTLMMLAGFEKPTSGAIVLDGRHIESLPPYQRNMGVVFQSYSLFPHMTVAQNVAFPLVMRRVAKPEIKERVSRALDKVKLLRHADRRPAQLSGGEQQRVALARALVFDPRLVLMDEPLSALDKNLREELQLEIRRLHRELGVTMVFVTHDQSEAMTLSDRIAVFNHGKIAQLGRPADLYERPQNDFVAGFVGDNNTATGMVESVGDDGSVAVRVGTLTLGARLHPGRLAVGNRCLLAVRPEAIRLSPIDAILGEPRANRVTAGVADMIHQGDHFRIVVQPKLGDETERTWMVKCATAQLPPAIAPGSEIVLTFLAEQAWALERQD
jgi:putative spermidine/putrescine transport system ATP-binding protein